jgi:clan AA aspartic protease
MGLIRTPLSLSNPRQPGLEPVEFEALVDTGSVLMCLPAHIAEHLSLEAIEHRDVTVADGRRQRVPYVGPLQVTFQNRTSFTGALVMGDEVILGAIPMEDMDLVINPTRLRVTVNPASPDIASSIVK